MIRVGILGFGFMGHMHFNNYKNIEGVEVVAVCDIQKEKLSPKTNVAGNINGSVKELDFTNVGLFTDAEQMFKEADIDAVSITLPTYLHKQYTISALSYGIDVFCEKPMALNSNECSEMIDAAKKYGKHIQVGHCIRFWPAYAEAKRIVDSGKYGNVKAATFRRLSLTPNWAWDNWILDERRSGGAMLDLHIHDTDYIQYLFGIPLSVFSTATKGQSGGYDHTVTQYIYDDNKVVAAEGGWIMTDSFGFKMSFEIVLEECVLCFDSAKSDSFTLFPAGREKVCPEIDACDGYYLELRHFIEKIKGSDVPQVITATDSMSSVALIECEKNSANKRALIAV